MSAATSDATNPAEASARSAAPPDATPILEVRELSKEFPGVLALDRVSLTVMPGEVHALVGENGAGKSTLVKALSGVHKPDGGEVILDGRPYAPRDPEEALTAGIRVVYQELNLLTYLTIEENLSFERLPSKRGLVDRATMRTRAEELMAEVGLDMPPDTAVEDLGIAQMQLVEIARALLTEARVLILDEPTATLTPRETDQLFGIVRKLAERGIGILFISHHLDEVKEIGDRVTVFRNGGWVATRDVAEVGHEARAFASADRLVRERRGPQRRRRFVVLRAVGFDRLTVEFLRGQCAASCARARSRRARRTARSTAARSSCPRGRPGRARKPPHSSRDPERELASQRTSHQFARDRLDAVALQGAVLPRPDVFVQVAQQALQVLRFARRGVAVARCEPVRDGPALPGFGGLAGARGQEAAQRARLVGGGGRRAELATQRAQGGALRPSGRRSRDHPRDARRCASRTKRPASRAARS